MKHKTLMAALLFVSLLGSFVEAQTVTLTPSVTSGNGSLSTSLTWSTTPAAASCTASGHASWTGTKAASGTLALPAITLSGSYNLTLACTWPGVTGTTITWVSPTTNTDGSNLPKCANADAPGNCLAFFHVYRRVGSPDLSTGAEVTPVRDPNATSRAYTALGAGTHYFAVEAFNGNGVPSVLSAVTTRVITAAVTRTESVTVTVNPKPNPPVIVE
jgi:hypothetical protein